MLTPVILGIGLLLATAVIAYWSDNLGKKLGKKRVSIFGLRPRQTATVITIVSSWVIMLFTVLALLAVYAPLRNALFQYDRERAENRQLRSDKKQLEGDKKQLESGVAQLNTQQSTLTRRIQESRRATQAARRAFNQTRKSLFLVQGDALKARRAERSARNNERRARRGESVARHNQGVATRNAARAQQRAQVALANFQNAKTQLTNTRQQRDMVREELKTERKDLIASRKNLKQVRQQYETAQVSLRNAGAQLLKLGRDVISAERAVSKAQTRVVDLERQIEDKEKTLRSKEESVRVLSASVDRLSAAIEALTKINTDISTGKIRIAYGVTFATRTIAPRLNRGAALTELRALLSEARASLQKSNNFKLELASLKIEREGQSVELGEAELLEVLADYLGTFDTPVSVRVIAARDHAEGETEIITRMVPVAVRTALTKGQVLASATLEGVKTDAQIFKALLAMIDTGRLFAERERGVVPPISRDSPNFFAPDTNERIFEALRRIEAIQEKGGRISVRLVAADELSTIESPRVKFEVQTDA